MPGPKVPRPEIAMSPGVPIASRDELLAWLDAQAEKLIRVPLVLVRGDVGFSLRGARIGELEVLARDTALGLGLAARARRQCGDATTCAMWVDGYWHVLRGDHFQLDVVHAGATITPEELATATTFVRDDES